MFLYIIHVYIARIGQWGCFESETTRAKSDYMTHQVVSCFEKLRGTAVRQVPNIDLLNLKY